MIYDMIIIGGGPAGLTASIYGLRAGKKVLLVERMMPGGQVALTTNIKNYPGLKDIDGMTLASNMFEQATLLGLETIFADVLEYNLSGEEKSVRTHEGTFFGKTIILCLGASARQLQLPNEKEYLGKGVSYCATCDGNFFKDKSVAVVGGGNSAIEDAIYLSDLAKTVYLIHRRDSFRADKTSSGILENLSQGESAKLKLILNSTVTKIEGNEKLTSIEIENKLTKEKQKISVDGLFIAIGRKPDTDLVKDIITTDENGYIITDEKMKTNIDGVYACGDVRQKFLRQIVTACSDGAIASFAINEYLSKKG